MSDHGSESGFVQVDQSDDPHRYVRRLDQVRATPFWRSIKDLTFRLLDLTPSGTYLDVGCGTGDDAAAMADQGVDRALVVGLERSATMLSEARARFGNSEGLAFTRGDSEHLPFADGSFDGARVERLLQHVVDPRLTLAEIIRVLRPGGRLVAAEPDYGTLIVTGADARVTRAILDERCRHFRSGRIGHQLPAYFRAMGLIEPVLKVFTQTESALASDRLASLRENYAEPAVARGVVSAHEARAWLDDLQRSAESGRYRHAVAIFVAAGRKRPLGQV